MRIIPRGEIPLQPARSTTPMGQVEGWVYHWVGSQLPDNPTEEQSKATLRNLQQSAFSEDYTDIEYNFAVDPAGRLFELRGWNNKNGANGNSTSNAHAWAVCSLSGPGTAFPQAEKDAVLWLAQEGARRVSTVRYVIGHREVSGVSTACPGDERTAYTNTMEANLHADAPAPAPQPNPERELMLIYAPARQQKQGSSQPTFLRLDVEKRQVVGHNGARLKEGGKMDGDTLTYPLPGEPVGWVQPRFDDGKVDVNTILIPIKGNSDKPIHLHFA